MFSIQPYSMNSLFGQIFKDVWSDFGQDFCYQISGTMASGLSVSNSWRGSSTKGTESGWGCCMGVVWVFVCVSESGWRVCMFVRV